MGLWEVDKVEDRVKPVDFNNLSPEERIKYMRDLQNKHRKCLQEEALNAIETSLDTLNDDQLLEIIKLRRIV
jgi:hypothetical protein